jgi:hypothetical protein
MTANSDDDGLTAVQLGEALLLTATHVRRLANDGILPRQSNGRFDVRAATHGYIRHLRRGGAAYQEARAEYRRTKAEAAALALKLKSGELVPASEVAETWGALVTVLKTRLLAIPSRVAARWGMVRSTVEAAAMVREEICETLTILSKGTVESTRPLQIEHSIAMGGPTVNDADDADADSRAPAPV